MASEGWPSIFEDSGELEHVIELLCEYSKIPDTVPESKIDSTFKPNSPLPVLEKRLRELLALAGVGADCFDEEGVIWPLTPLNTLQEAAVDAYRHVHRLRTPLDVQTSLQALTSVLWKLHGIVRDLAHQNAEQQRRGKRKSRQHANKLRIENAHSQHDLWRQEADRIREEFRHIASKSDIARLLKQRLKLDHAVETIRKVL